MVRYLKRSLLSILVLAVLPCAAHAAAEKSAAKSVEEDHLKKIADNLQKARSQIVEKDKVERQVLASLYQINKHMRKMSKKRAELTDKVFGLEGNVRALAKAIAKLERKIERQRRNLQKRLKALYMLNGQGAMRILFSSTSAHDFDRNLKFLKLVSDRDYDLIKNYEYNRQDLAKKREDLKKQVKNLLVAERKLKEQESRLVNQQSSKTKLLGRLKNARRQSLAKMRGIRAQAKGLEAEQLSKDLALLLEDSFFERRGQIGWPVAGSMKRGYGYIQNDEYRYRLSHKGIFFRTEKGAEVRGVFPGRVTYVGPLPGYGKAIILDHGDHYYTVYAHNADVEVKAHQQVTEGQVIAHAGVSVADGPGLYFEIRHFSEAIDPEPWLGRQNKIAREKP